jgi:quercetin dioxygenase-like cupin family protein
MFKPPYVAVIGTFLSAVVLGQRTVPMSEDPHYKRLLYTAHLRMFEVAIPAGASTLDHTHDHDVVTVALNETTVRTRRTGEDWSQPQSYRPGGATITNYTGAMETHRVENAGKTPHRAIEVENLRDKGWSMPQLISGPATALLHQSRSFAVYEVRLNASAQETSHQHQMPTVVVLVAGAVQVQGGGGESEFRMDAPGRWFASQRDQPHTLTLAGTGDAHLVEVEAR